MREMRNIARRMKKAVCLTSAMAIMLSNSAMAAENIRIGGYLDQTGDVLMLVLNQNSDKDTFSGSDIAYIQQQHVGSDGYFTMELPLLDNVWYDFYSNAKFKTQYSDTVRSGSIYVSSAGSDDNDGKSEDAPMGTLAAALKVAAKLNYEKVVLLSDIDYEECPVSYEGIIIIEGKTGEEKLNVETNSILVNSSKHVNFKGDTTLKHLVLSSDTQINLFANGHKLIIDEDVTTEKRVGVFGGSRSAKLTGSTDITVLGGKYNGIWGGGLSGDVTGDTHVVVGGNVNAGDGINDSDSSISPCAIWGGGSTSSVLGATHVTLKDSAVTKYLCGGSENSKGKEVNTNVVIEGGKAMNVYGGSAKSGSTDLESCNTHITMTGGMVEAIFGGSEKNAMTGNTYVYLKGGEVTRRVYTGCYNDYNGSWGSDNFVAGTTNLIISPGVSVNTTNGLSGTNALNVGLFAGSRTAASHTGEKNTIIYTNNCINNFKNQVGDKSGYGSTFKSFANYTVDVKTGGEVEPVSAGVIKITPDVGNVAYVDNTMVESEELNISDENTVVVEFSKLKETLNIGIDYENEELTGFESGKSYTIKVGDNEAQEITPTDTTVALDDAKIGYAGAAMSLEIVKKGDGTNTSDSIPQSLTIPARPSAPTSENITVTTPTVIGGKGSISGVTSAMEYSTDRGIYFNNTKSA